MSKLNFLFKIILRQFKSNLTFFILSLVGFTISIGFYLYSSNLKAETESELASNQTFEIWRLFDFPPMKEGFWDEFVTFLSIKMELLKASDMMILFMML